MAYFKEKHEVLRLFIERFESHPPNEFIDGPDDELKRCLTSDKICDKTKFDDKLVNNIIHSLKSARYIAVFHEPQLDPYHMCEYLIITRDGQSAYEDKFYPSQHRQTFVRKLGFWFSLLSLLISVASFILNRFKL